MMRILLVTDQAFWRSRGGAHQRIDSLWTAVRQLLGDGDQPALGQVFYVGDPALLPEDLSGFESQAGQVICPRQGHPSSKPTWFWPLNRRRSGSSSSAPATSNTSRSLRLSDYRWPWILPHFHRCVQHFQPQVVILEYVTLMYLIEGVPADLRQEIVWAVDTHDCLSRRCQQFRDAGESHWLEIDEAEEVAALSAADLVIAIQADEAEWFQERLPGRTVVVAGHGPTLDSHADLADDDDQNAIGDGSRPSDDRSGSVSGAAPTLRADTLNEDMPDDLDSAEWQLGAAAATVEDVEQGFDSGFDIAFSDDMAGPHVEDFRDDSDPLPADRRPATQLPGTSAEELLARMQSAQSWPPPADSAAMATTRQRPPAVMVLGLLASDNFPNRRAIEDWLDQVWLALPWPAVQLVVGGTICSCVEQWLARNSTEDRGGQFMQLLGSISHLSTFYQAVDVALNPTTLGTGLKIKTAEALAFGKPVLATPHAAGDFADRDCGVIVWDDAEACREQIMQLLRDPQHLARQVAQARSCAATTLLPARVYQDLVSTLRHQVTQKTPE